MNNAFKIAGFGLAAGAAVMIAFSAPAIAHGRFGGFGADTGMGGAMGGALGAGPRGGVLAVQFTDLDTDGDGKITEAELTARAQALAADRLEGVDADGDGAITAAEIEAQIVARIGAHTQGRVGKGPLADDPATMAKTLAERILAARDADEDGLLSGDELSPAADMAALIDRFDTDDDNAWSEEEFAQVAMRKGGVGSDRHGMRGSKGGWDGKRR